MCRRRIQAPDRFFMEFLSGANVSGQPTRTCRCHSKWQISRMQIPRGRRESASTLVRRRQPHGGRSGFAVRGSTAVASPTAARRPWQIWACAGQKQHAIRPWPAVDYAEVRRDVNRTSASLAWIQGCMRAGSTRSRSRSNVLSACLGAARPALPGVLAMAHWAVKQCAARPVLPGVSLRQTRVCQVAEVISAQRLRYALG